MLRISSGLVLETCSSVRLATETALPFSFLVPLTTVGGGEDSMDGSGVDFGEPAAYREFTCCEDGGGVMVS